MTEWNADNPADLGIWDDLGWTQPPPEKKAKSLKLNKKDTEHHFAKTDGDNSCFLSPSKGLESYQEPYCPKNTAVSTRWALKNFSDCTSSYNSRHPDAPCPEGILLSDDTKLLSFWLQKFVVLTRKKTGEKYRSRIM